MQNRPGIRRDPLRDLRVFKMYSITTRKLVKEKNQTLTSIVSTLIIVLLSACDESPTGIDPEDPIMDIPYPCENGLAAGFKCSNVDLLSFLTLSELGGGTVPGTVPSDSVPDITVNDMWGWTDPLSNIEYALVGRTDGMAFVSLENPKEPLYLGQLLRTGGTPVSHWRDVKVYANHAFIVADRASQHGVQVFDLTQLRNIQNPPLTFQETTIYDGIASAHNIAINEASGFAYVVGATMGGDTCGRGLHIIDIQNPANPKFSGCFADHSTGREGSGYTHDAQCIIYAGPDGDHQGKEICLGSNENAMSIADVTDKENPVAISRAVYPNFGYVHQGWISENHRYFFMDDETDELRGFTTQTRTLVWDIEDLDDPVLLKEHFGVTTSSDHNIYIRGNYMYQSNYASGLRILDVSDPANPTEIGFFDTVTATVDAPGYDGSWSNYPFFESGVIAFTSRKEGLFLVRKRTN